VSTLESLARDGIERLSMDAEVKRRALTALRPWLLDEGFAAYRPQLEALLRKGRFETLVDMFWQVIPFGTGGRRGAVGLGTNRFNPWTLGTSVQGHAEILRETYPGEEVSVVIAFDVRVYRDVRGVYDPSLPNPLLGLTSADFARLAAGVYAANGVRVHMVGPEPADCMSTPELSLAIRRLGAQAGSTSPPATTIPTTTAASSTTAPAARTCRPTTRSSRAAWRASRRRRRCPSSAR
jgi:phosphoglucomutase/phosphomannomutase